MASSGQLVQPPVHFILVSAGVPSGTTTLQSNCRGLRIGTGGTLHVTMKNGEQCNNFPVFAGDNPGMFSEVRNGGTATDIWQIL